MVREVGQEVKQVYWGKACRVVVVVVVVIEVIVAARILLHAELHRFSDYDYDNDNDNDNDNDGTRCLTYL